MIDLSTMMAGLFPKKEPTAFRMCNFCSRRHVGGRKNCRIYKSIKPNVSGSTCPPKRQREVRAMTTALAQERAK
jgi:hypothetical protein